MKNTLIQIALFCIMGCGLVACAQQVRTGTLQDGRALEEQGNYIGAMKHYQKMPESGFRSVCTHNLRHLYGDIFDAMIAQRDNPNSAETYYDLGKAYYEKALSIPRDHEIVPNQGFDSNAYFVEQREQFYSQAQVALESATQVRTDYENALLLKGNLYEDIEEPEKAIPVYQQLVELDTESSEVFSRLGTLLHDRGQTEEALELATQATTMTPDDPDAHFVLGKLQAREGDNEQALAEFQQVLCLEPHYTDAYYSIAQVYLRQNNLIDAERILRLGLLNNPGTLRLSIFYNPLKSILDSKELDEFVFIYQALFGEVVDRLLIEAIEDSDFEPSPALEIRFLRLQQNIMRRHQPYVLPCSGEEEHPYFGRQIALMQEKIEKLEQSIQAEAEAVQAEAESVQAEKETTSPEE